MNEASEAAELQRIYQRRFEETRHYRNRVWKVLISDFLHRFINPSASVLDLGCGYGEFINNVSCARKFAMDLNPESEKYLSDDVTFLRQDCSEPWKVPETSLDVVFTSNFFEHLPSKDALTRTLQHAFQRLKPGGLLIAVGPNLRYLAGSYWDFWDHHLPLTHLSLAEVLQLRGFRIIANYDKFMPYTLVNTPKPPLIFVRAYLRFPAAWRWLGKQFLIVAQKELNGG